MAVVENTDLERYCRETAQRARAAALRLTAATGQQKNAWLRASAAALRERTDEIVAVNQRDIEAAPDYGLTDAAVDRLRLSPERIEGIATAVEEIAALPDPVGQIISSSMRPNGLEVQKVRVPLGVIFFIYESRPNVTVDAAALSVKSGNAVILRGGKEAAHSNAILAEVLSAGLADAGLPDAALQLVATKDRAAVGQFLSMPEQIDVTIPRGGESLIRRVAAEARMPVIKHFDGNCHVYIDQDADLKTAEEIVVNSKCQRLGVCNTAESLLVHEQVAAQFLPQIAKAIGEHDTEIPCDDGYRAEYLAPIISVKVVGSLGEAIDHINEFGSHHTDAIVTQSLAAARQFAVGVDSAAVMINASTRFHDGGEFGLGAEIGISTDKLHARGPCGLEELTSYKYICYGNGQTRS